MSLSPARDLSKALRDVCNTSGKNQYTSQAEADMMARHFSSVRAETMLRTYLCHFCGNWHLTKSPRR